MPGREKEWLRAWTGPAGGYALAFCAARARAADQDPRRRTATGLSLNGINSKSEPWTIDCVFELLAKYGLVTLTLRPGKRSEMKGCFRGGIGRRVLWYTTS